MIRECPVCHRPFESLIANATYCNSSCRKKAGREKEKTKASMFYQGPKDYDPRVLYTLSSPSLEELDFWANLLEMFVRQTKEERAIMVYGNMPEGWKDKEFVQIFSQWGAKPPCWAMGCNLPIAAQIVRQGALVEKPVGKEQKAQILESVLSNDAEVERILREEKQPYLGRPL